MGVENRPSKELREVGRDRAGLRLSVAGGVSEPLLKSLVMGCSSTLLLVNDTLAVKIIKANSENPMKLDILRRARDTFVATPPASFLVRLACLPFSSAMLVDDVRTWSEVYGHTGWG